MVHSLIFLFWLACWAFAAFALAVCVIFCYEFLNSSVPVFSKLKFGPVFCLRLFAQCFVMAWLHAFVRIYSFIFRRIPAFRRPEQPLPEYARPVILLHGFMDSPTIMFQLAKRLRKAGFGVSHFEYDALRGDPEEVNRNLHRHIASVRGSGGRVPALVGYSLGGLIAARALLTRERPDEICGIITVGTPFHGSRTAVFNPSRMSRELLPGSRLVDFVSKGTFPDEIPGLVIASPTDEMVMPPASLLPPEKAAHWRLRVTGPLSHISLLFSGEVAELIIKELNEYPA